MTNSPSAEAIVSPWYNQFYLRRGEAGWNSDRISTEGFESGLEAVEGFVFVGTTMYGNPVRITVFIHSSDPGPPDSAAERVVEARLDGTGDVAIHGWDPDDDPVAYVAVPPGELHLRASWLGMAEASEHPDCDIGGDDVSPEHVTIEFWPVEHERPVTWPG